MASGIEAAPFSLRDARFIIKDPGGERDYTASVSHVLFAPDVQWGSATTLVGALTHHWVQAVSWTLALEYPQDWAESSSLSLYLSLHAKEQREVVFVPKDNLGTHQVRATVTLAPGPIGGQAGPLLTGIVVMGVNGEPIVEPISAAA